MYQKQKVEVRYSNYLKK